MAEIIGRRRKRERSYVSIENSMFEDAELSYRAKGVLGYLLSKPDDWIVRISDLTKRGKEGRDAIYTALNELKDLKYLHFYQPRDSKGHWLKALWEYDDVPFESTFPIERTLDNSEFVPCPENPYTENQDADKLPFTEKPYAEKPYTDNQETLIKNDLSKKDFNKKDNKKAKAIADKILSEKVFEKEGKYSALVEIVRAWDFTSSEISEILAQLGRENLNPSSGMVLDQCKAMKDNPQITGSKVGYFVNGIRIRLKIKPRPTESVIPNQQNQPKPEERLVEDLNHLDGQLNSLIAKIFPDGASDLIATVRRVYMKYRFQISLTDYQIILNEFKPKINQARNGNLDFFLGGFIKKYLAPTPFKPAETSKSAEKEKTPTRTEMLPDSWVSAEDYYKQFETNEKPVKKIDWKVNNLWD